MKIHILNNFLIGKNHLGKAVFSAKNFKKNDVITKFEGDIFEKKDLPKKLVGESDRFVQIGIDKFMGPSEKIDDYINHSCNPNSGLHFTKSGILLVAIKSIKIGEEITWDYSTTLFHNEWKMICKCGEKNCRKIISDFILLDPKIQKKYLKLEILPQYIVDYIHSSDYVIYTKGVNSLKKYAKK